MVPTSRRCLFAFGMIAFAFGGCAAPLTYSSAHLINVTADPGVRVQSVRYGRCVGSGRACVFVARQSCTVFMGWTDHARVSVGLYRPFAVVAPGRDGSVLAIGAWF